MKSIETILSIGAMFYRIDRAILIGRSRELRTVRIRNSIIGVCHGEGHTCSAIGRALDKDHTTIRNSVQSLTREYMGPMWPRHEVFVEVVESAGDGDSLSECVDAMIGEIDSKIRSLQKVREIVTSVRKLVSDAETPTHWQEK